jgi:hypothetical protein
MAKSTLVPPPFEDWSQFFDPQYDADFRLLALERWYDGMRGKVRTLEPPYNAYIGTEVEARTAWDILRTTRGVWGEPYPGDRTPRTYSGRGEDGLQIF